MEIPLPNPVGPTHPCDYDCAHHRELAEFPDWTWCTHRIYGGRPVRNGRDCAHFAPHSAAAAAPTPAEAHSPASPPSPVKPA